MSGLTGDSRDVRRDGVVTVSTRDTVQAAVRRMRTGHTGFLVVLDDEGRIAGVLTDRDVTTRVVARGSDASILQVGDVMSQPVHTLESGQAQAEAARRMRRHRVRRLPVVDVAGSPVGVVSTDDLLRVVSARLSALEGGLRVEARNEADPAPPSGDSNLGKE